MGRYGVNVLGPESQSFLGMQQPYQVCVTPNRVGAPVLVSAASLNP